MSLKNMKSDLEAYLIANLSDVSIKYNNTNIYILNGVQLNQSQIDSLGIFIDIELVPNGNKRELISSNAPFKTKAFFQLNIYNKLGTGTGLVYTTIETLDSILREKLIGVGTTAHQTETLPSVKLGEHEITPHLLECSYWN